MELFPDTSWVSWGGDIVIIYCIKYVFNKNDDLVYDKDPNKPVKKWWNAPPKLFATREMDSLKEASMECYRKLQS